MSELVKDAVSVAELAAARSAESERSRQLTPDVADALTECGFARHFAPRDVGGRDGTFGELNEALALVGEGCASAAWCALVYASSGRIAALLPQRGREEVWEGSPDTRIATALAPAGRATPIDGGWELHGSWGSMSGIDYAPWIVVCSVPEGDEPRFFAVPTADVSVEDTWFTLGMRGTGSNTATTDGVFVPEHRSYPQRHLLSGVSDERDGELVPLLGAMPPMFAAPALGSARHALASWVEHIRKKTGPDGPAWREQITRDVLMRATADIDAAALLLDHAAACADRGQLFEQEVLRNARAAAMAGELLRSAVDRVFGAGGTSVQVEGHPVQQAWRDVHAATSHNVLRFAWTRDQLASTTWGG